MTPEHWPEGLGSSADGAGPTSGAFVVSIVTSVCVFNALVDSLTASCFDNMRTQTLGYA